MKYKILQLKNSKDVKYSFMGHDYAINNGFSLDDYKLVYENDINTFGKCIDDILEKLFYIFNIEKPLDFKGHSLSVSDIIELNNKKYYVDDFGFTKID